MQRIIQYTIHYFRSVNKLILIYVSLFTGLIVFMNYQYGIDEMIRKNILLPVKLFSWYIVFLLAFGLPYLYWKLIHRPIIAKPYQLLALILLAPAIFAIKMSIHPSFQWVDNAAWNNYWNKILYWPILLLTTALLLYSTRKLFSHEKPFYGLRFKKVEWKPYWLMLFAMIPLIALASTQADFLRTYPKYQSLIDSSVDGMLQWWHILLYELSYGSDFFTIELFFRGFLILGFVKYAGKDAILPMACFYCAIHFGKPMAECISSYFGGIILGIVVYNTRSIAGGLLVHLGIAWLMELGGYFGNILIR